MKIFKLWFWKRLWQDIKYDWIYYPIHNFFLYRKIVSRTRPWDYQYILEMMRFQLTLLNNQIKKYDREIDETRIPKEKDIDRCIELLGNLIADNYEERCGFIYKERNWDQMWRPIDRSDESYEIFKDENKDDCELFEYVDVDTEEERKINIKALNDAHDLQAKEIDELFNIMKNCQGGWDERKHTKFMKISFPETNSVIEGEAGDSLGRGAKFTLYLIDEAAWLERPEAADAALSQSAECLIYVSTPKGTNNPFFNKRQSGNFPVFTFHWTDDPTKDEMWYEKEKKKIDDPAIVAQELDISYTASVEGIVIPYVWVEAAVDAHEKLGIKVVGERSMGLDVADEGGDMNAVCVRHGILITKIEEWGGGGGDIYKTVEHVFTIAKDSACSLVSFDSDGLGAGVRGDARNINKGLKTEEKVEFVPFRGSGGVVDPEKEMIAGRTNEDFFRNFKAQAMWALRTRFQNTYRAVVEKLSFQPDEIISISSNCKNYRKLMLQISQPTYKTDAVGRIVIDKKPNGAKSPDLADAVMIAFAPKKKKMWSASSGIFRQSI